MTSIERLARLQEMKVEFEDKATTDQRRVELLTQVRDWAEDEIPESRCRQCGHSGICIIYDYALIEGHCYSASGIREYQSLSKICEYCFDKMHKTPGDDSVPDVGPRDSVKSP